MKNNFPAMSNGTLHVKVTQAATAINAVPGAYGTSPEQEAALTAAATALGAAITAANDARAASRTATETLDAARAQTLAILGSVGGTIYYDPDVTKPMLLEAGYAIHDTVPTKHAPVQPLDLTSEPNEFGTVLFTWNGNGNVYPTYYTLEGRASESDAWATVVTTTKKRISVEGFTPGAPYMFRVKASRIGQDSIYSNVSWIWTPEGVELEIAA